MAEPRTDMKVVAEYDGWVMLRDTKGEPFFGDKQGRDIADCPVSQLMDLERDSKGT